MSKTMEQYRESANFLQSKLGEFIPKVLLILGSGLGFLGDSVKNPVTVPYKEIPHFKPSTAPGHAGQFVFGELEGQKVAVMQGRMHYYEGYDFSDVTYAVRVLKLLGCEMLFVTNAAGCVNKDWNCGDLMLIEDHLKLSLVSPLRGENLPEFGTRFPDASQLYTPRLLKLAETVGESQNLKLRRGVYCLCAGPQYETPSEVRAIRILGADAVGMSTAPEVIVAGHCGMEVLGISLLTNMASGILDQPLSEQEVLDAAAAAKEKFSSLICACLKEI